MPSLSMAKPALWLSESLLLFPLSPSYACPCKGFQALKHLFSVQSSSPTRLLLGCRDPESATRSLEVEASPAHQFQTLPLDLRSQASVRSFASSVLSILGETKINVLLLSAGALKNTRENDALYGEDFVVNHLCA